LRVLGFLNGLFLLLVAGLAGAQTPAPTQMPLPAKMPIAEGAFTWQQPSRTDGILLYWSKVSNTDIVAFKGEGIVDAPIDKVATIIVDTSRGTEWIDGLVESRVLKSVSPTEFIEYDHQGIPFPFDQLISDRDFVSQVSVEPVSEVHGLTIRYGATEDASMPPIKKYVRGELRYCVFKLMPMSLPNQTYVVAEVDADPKGRLAPWLVNFFQEGWPHATFQNLRQEAKKTDIQPFDWVDRLIDSTGPFAWSAPDEKPMKVKKRAPARFN
jgi:START domain